MIIFLSFYLIFINIFNIKNFDTIINPIIWLILFIITFYINQKDRVKKKNEKEQIILIVVLISQTLYFLSGLIFGYNKNTADFSFVGILINLESYIFLIIYQEYVRNYLVKKKPIMCFIIFTLLEINISILFKLNNLELLKTISQLIVPAISSNLLLNYLSKTAGYKSTLLYKIPIVFTSIFLPIIPNLNWFINSLYKILLPFIVYILIFKLNNRKERTRNKVNIFVLSVLIIFVCFIAGLFKYKIIGIASNSMKNYINRGDAVIVLDTKEIKLYDIIEYKLDKIRVVHRVVSIEKYNNGKTLYITKGDNNNVVDKEKVTEDQIVGKVLFKIPYIGYPSVWLNDLFQKG